MLMKNQTILITGGAGFIGSNLANYLSKNNKVIIVDDLSMGRLSNLVEEDNIDVHIHSITDYIFLDTIFKQYKFDYIFHMAAVASVADSIKRPLQTHEINSNSVIHILELIKKYQPELKRIIFASSAAVYGNLPDLPKRETSDILPATPYAIDKFSSESYLLNYGNSCGVKASAARFFNVFGENQNPSSPYSGVLSILMDKLKKQLSGRQAVFTCFGDGNQTRDFIYIRDVINALVLIAENEKSIGEFYNIGYGKPTSLLEIIELMEEVTNQKIELKYQEERMGDIKYSYCDNQKLKSLGFLPMYTVRDGLVNYINSELGTNYE